MRWTRWIAVTLTIAALTAAAALVSAQTSKTTTTTTATTKKTSPASSRKALVDRGMYLTTVGGCNDCHTPGTLYGSPDWDRKLAGSEIGWQGPWGVSYARNLTPDLETGLGKWTEDQIVNTLKTGVHPDGHVLLPPMPWPNTSQMTDPDMRAIAAYLKTLKPVEHQVPKAVPPGQTATGSIIVFPPPSAWDAPRAPADSAGK